MHVLITVNFQRVISLWFKYILFYPSLFCRHKYLPSCLSVATGMIFPNSVIPPHDVHVWVYISVYTNVFYKFLIVSRNNLTTCICMNYVSILVYVHVNDVPQGNSLLVFTYIVISVSFPLSTQGKTRLLCIRLLFILHTLLYSE